VRYFRLTTSALTLALLLAGCVHVPQEAGAARAPDFKAARHAAIDLGPDAWPVERWWQDYRDPQLDRLVGQALAGNPGLAVAAARVRIAAAPLTAAQAAGGLQAGLETGINRQRYSANGFFPAPIGGSWYTDTTLQGRIGYEADWWGKHRAQVAAAIGEQNAAAAQASQAQQALAASVAQSYFRLQLLWARLANVTALTRVEQRLLQDRKARLAHGLATVDTQRSIELELGKLAEQAALLETQAGREREALRALLGAGPDDLAALEHRLPQGAQAALPRELGMELLARRPDLQAARWRVEAALGRAAAAEAAFYPDLNLSGAIGLNAVSLGKLLRGASRTFLAGAVLDLPLFDSGRLDAKLGIARAERDALLLEYNESVLNAVREVAAEAVTLQGIERELAAHAQSAEASARLAASAEARLARGLAERSAVLVAQVEVLRQRGAALQLQDAQLQTRVALVKALGGGYRAAPTHTAAVNASTR
jgi:multidrug efflux system outer membrane protein